MATKSAEELLADAEKQLRQVVELLELKPHFSPETIASLESELTLVSLAVERLQQQVRDRSRETGA